MDCNRSYVSVLVDVSMSGFIRRYCTKCLWTVLCVCTRYLSIRLSCYVTRGSKLKKQCLHTWEQNGCVREHRRLIKTESTVQSLICPDAAFSVRTVHLINTSCDWMFQQIQPIGTHRSRPKNLQTLRSLWGELLIALFSHFFGFLGPCSACSVSV